MKCHCSNLVKILTWVCDQVSEFLSFPASCTNSCLYDKVPVNTTNSWSLNPSRGRPATKIESIQA